MEQSTLVEPNNVVPLWERGTEEMKEVSMTLGVLRQQFDRVHTTVLEKEKWHEELRKWLDEVCDDEINAEDNSVEMKELMENAEDKLAWTQHWWD